MLQKCYNTRGKKGLRQWKMIRSRKGKLPAIPKTIVIRIEPALEPVKGPIPGLADRTSGQQVDRSVHITWYLKRKKEKDNTSYN